MNSHVVVGDMVKIVDDFVPPPQEGMRPPKPETLPNGKLALVTGEMMSESEDSINQIKLFKVEYINWAPSSRTPIWWPEENLKKV